MKNKLLLISTLVITTISIAQIKVYTPSASVKGTKTDNSYKWAVKADLLQFVVGEFPIAFEYRVATKLSVEASAGITYTFLENGPLFEDVLDIRSNDTRSAMGTSFRGALKYYPSADYDAIEGWYFGLQVFNKTNKRDYVGNNSIFQNNSTTANDTYAGKQDVETKTGLSLLIGKQIFADSNIVFDTYIGVGIANVERKFYETKFYSGTGNDIVQPIETSRSIPNFQVGFKIGFGN